MSTQLLSTALTLRTVQRADLQAIVRLIYEIYAAEDDTSLATTPEDLENEWDYEGFDPIYGTVFYIGEHREMSGDYWISTEVITLHKQ